MDSLITPAKSVQPSTWSSENVDSDFDSYPGARRSITGYFIKLAGAPINWYSKKRSIVAQSSAEIEQESLPPE
jgi:hypothetical protein